MILVGYKAISQYLERTHQREFGEKAIRRYSQRESNPMPIRIVLGRAEIAQHELDQWMQRERTAADGRQLPLLTANGRL